MLSIRTLFPFTITAALVLAVASPAHAQMTTDVGGSAMYPAKDIVDNAVNSKDHTTLVAAPPAAMRPWAATTSTIACSAGCSTTPASRCRPTGTPGAC